MGLPMAYFLQLVKVFKSVTLVSRHSHGSAHIVHISMSPPLADTYLCRLPMLPMLQCCFVDCLRIGTKYAFIFFFFCYNGCRASVVRFVFYCVSPFSSFFFNIIFCPSISHPSIHPSFHLTITPIADPCPSPLLPSSLGPFLHHIVLNIRLDSLLSSTFPSPCIAAHTN